MEELQLNQNKLRGLPPDLGHLARLRDLQVLGEGSAGEGRIGVCV